jgi:hypothetical protein
VNDTTARRWRDGRDTALATTWWDGVEHCQAVLTQPPVLLDSFGALREASLADEPLQLEHRASAWLRGFEYELRRRTEPRLSQLDRLRLGSPRDDPQAAMRIELGMALQEMLHHLLDPEPRLAGRADDLRRRLRHCLAIVEGDVERGAA